MRNLHVEIYIKHHSMTDFLHEACSFVYLSLAISTSLISKPSSASNFLLFYNGFLHFALAGRLVLLDAQH